MNDGLVLVVARLEARIALLERDLAADRARAKNGDMTTLVARIANLEALTVSSIGWARKVIGAKAEERARIVAWMRSETGWTMKDGCLACHYDTPCWSCMADLVRKSAP